MTASPSTPSTDMQARPLAGIRVIDLATGYCEIAGRLLADMGAEVIKIEPPGGHPSRRHPPFVDGREGELDGSLHWAAYAIGKRSVVLDLDDEGDRAQLRELARGADVLVESLEPGALAAIGLGYEDLSALNPALVYASITPFGQDGPHAHRPATDLTLQAAGGLVSMQGDPDRPPIPVGFPQAGLHAGVQAAADIAVALNERDASGLGQHLDTSIQACVVWTLLDATGYPPNEGGDKPGYGDDRADAAPPRTPGLDLPTMLEVADGYTTSTMGVHPAMLNTTSQAVAWLLEDGPGLPEHLHGIDWEHWHEDWVEPGVAPESAPLVNEALQHVLAFLRSRTKAELHPWSLATKALVAKIANAKDLIEDPQLEARGYWRQVGGHTVPGPFARFVRTPVGSFEPAPALSEGAALLDAPRTPAVNGTRSSNGAEASNGPRPRTFEGVKVADFSWYGVGPLIAKGLADHGATVVHVESERHFDGLRLGPPFKDGEINIDKAQFFANFNSSKLGMSLDLSHEVGREIARDLTQWADVMVESFTPDTMERHGLNWDVLSPDHPELVMVRTCLRGQTGPERRYTGFGMQGAALAGLHAVTGWPDRAPVGPYGAYTDFINPRFGLLAVASALYERRRSGLGQLIDLSQAEAAIHFQSPLVLDYAANGRVAGAAGHDSMTDAPNGVYACRGVERYIAISCATTEQWHTLRDLAGLEGFDRPEYETYAGRQADRARIDAALAAWCADRDGHELAATLTEAGVPASAVLRATDLYEDAQLAHRDFFVTLDHPAMGPTPYDGLATQYSGSPGRLSKAAPMFGEDTYYVLTELLGASPDDVARFTESGALR
ncbi:MAG: CoA transferase [Chloroflexi bacterium]|nr:CoA transferase [Chloroflexota bacterium]